MNSVKFETGRGRVRTKDTPFYYYVKNGQFDIVWSNTIVFAISQLLMVYSFYEFFKTNNYHTFMWHNFLVTVGGTGITGGSHRLWAHRSYNARWPLRFILMIGQTIAGQNCIYVWARDHRVHHKWSDTDADPHNTKRGFFFAHCGWLMVRKHPELMAKSKTLDFSDLINDPLVKFQKDNYWIMYLVFALFLPMAIPVYCWGESWWTSYLIAYVMRYTLSLHGTWFVNSAAHMFGDRPYNAKLSPAENSWVSVVTFGEGYHNYHHHYPSDYQASEDGHGFNSTVHLINLMAKLGLAYNLRTTSRSVVEASKDKTQRERNNNDPCSSQSIEDDDNFNYVIKNQRQG
ncbi:Stearoyl-CoA desaturase 5 [Halotydeus destructor]|nr:Stearoyl-CoA desaturase 5 [Halotydeus destructor]